MNDERARFWADYDNLKRKKRLLHLFGIYKLHNRLEHCCITMRNRSSFYYKGKFIIYSWLELGLRRAIKFTLRA